MATYGNQSILATLMTLALCVYGVRSRLPDSQEALASAERPKPSDPPSDQTGGQPDDSFEDQQRDTQYHECSLGKGVANLSFTDEGRLLQEGEGMKTECKQVEKCARFCFDSETTCRNAPPTDSRNLLSNEQFYVSGWNITQSGDYLLYCCAASLLTQIYNCTNITIAPEATEVPETFTQDAVIKDIYFENGRHRKPTMVEVCSRSKSGLTTPIKLKCKLPHKGIHPKSHRPPPIPSNMAGEAGQLAGGTAAANGGDGGAVAAGACWPCFAAFSAFAAFAAFAAKPAGGGSGPGRRKRKAELLLDEHMRWMVFQAAKFSAPQAHDLE